MGMVYHRSLWSHSSQLHFSKQKDEESDQGGASQRSASVASPPLSTEITERGFFWGGGIVAQDPPFGVMNGSSYFFFWHGGRVSDRPQRALHARGGGGERARERERESN